MVGIGQQWFINKYWVRRRYRKPAPVRKDRSQPAAVVCARGCTRSSPRTTRSLRSRRRLAEAASAWCGFRADAASIGDRFLQAGCSRLRIGAPWWVAGWIEDGEAVDEVVVTFFQAPHSYTGEDLLEISAHGNPLILNRIVRSAIQLAGARLAAPGEFTLRAVAHGKMDLIQAEAVRDFIEAQTEHQARTALRQMEGALSKRFAR